MFGDKYDQTLSTEVANTRPGEQMTTVSLLLNGAFDRFEATVGRDDKEAGRGPGYVYFEVWGDDRLLVKSDAIGATRSPGGISSGTQQLTRRSPQDIETSVRGILQLKLVVRYASDLPQRGRYMDRAKGCVWANTRLTPAMGYIGKRASDPLRDALRLAALQLISTTMASLGQGEPSLRQFPLALGIAPLRPAESEDGEVAPEPMIRAALQELFVSASQNRQILFHPVERGGARLLSESFRANRPDVEETSALVDAGRKAGAALVVTGSYSGGPDGRVSLVLVDTRTGQKSPNVDVTIAALRSTKPLSTK
jgi:hypothetical protein